MGINILNSSLNFSIDVDIEVGGFTCKVDVAAWCYGKEFIDFEVEGFRELKFLGNEVSYKDIKDIKLPYLKKEGNVEELKPMNLNSIFDDIALNEIRNNKKTQRHIDKKEC